MFPVLENYIPRKGGPIEVMLREHKLIKSSIEEAKKHLGNSKWKSLIELVNNIIGVLRYHIHKEDNILFSMAKMHFNTHEEEERKVLKKMKEIEAQK